MSKTIEELTAQFKHLEKYVEDLDEIDKCRYLKYISSKILEKPLNVKAVDLLVMGDLVQTTEIVCAKLKTMIGDTKIKGIICKKCNKEVPEMRLKEHLSGVNKDCPHDTIEIIDEEQLEVEKLKLNS